MDDQKIHIYEENINLFWIVLGLITIAGGSYLLADAFFAGSWQWAGIQQISSLILFAIGFYSIIQLTEPLYHFILSTDKEILNVEIWKGQENHRGTNHVPIYEINEVKIISHSPPKENEALFDFSTNYHLLYRTSKEKVYQDLVTLPNQSFTLKLEDIQKIIRFIKRHNSSIDIDENYMLSKP